MFSGLVYLLCAVTSLICALMLLRAYVQSRVRLLFWSGLCFIGLLLENIMLYVDFVVEPDLALWRKVPGLIAFALLLFGLIWESK